MKPMNETKGSEQSSTSRSWESTKRSWDGTARISVLTSEGPMTCSWEGEGSSGGSEGGLEDGPAEGSRAWNHPKKGNESNKSFKKFEIKNGKGHTSVDSRPLHEAPCLNFLISSFKASTTSRTFKKRALDTCFKQKEGYILIKAWT